jgi:hypothetical protein
MRERFPLIPSRCKDLAVIHSRPKLASFCGCRTTPSIQFRHPPRRIGSTANSLVAGTSLDAAELMWRSKLILERPQHSHNCDALRTRNARDRRGGQGIMLAQIPRPIGSTALVAALLLWAAVEAPTITRADDCLTAPNSAPPAGSHWYYHTDSAKQRKCWYVRAAGPSAQHTIAQPPSDAANAIAQPASDPENAITQTASDPENAITQTASDPESAPQPLRNHRARHTKPSHCRSPRLDRRALRPQYQLKLEKTARHPCRVLNCLRSSHSLQ